MLVKEVMSKKPDYLSPGITLKQAADEMLKHNIGCVPIGDDNDERLIGFLTDRDIAIRGVAKGKDPNKTTVKEIMTKKVLYCYEDDDVRLAAKSMSKQHVRRLIVLNRKKRMTGIISLGDIAFKAKNELLTASTLCSVVEQERSH